jgi:hypothetical protein
MLFPYLDGEKVHETYSVSNTPLYARPDPQKYRTVLRRLGTILPAVTSVRPTRLEFVLRPRRSLCKGCSPEPPDRYADGIASHNAKCISIWLFRRWSRRVAALPVFIASNPHCPYIHQSRPGVQT